MEGFALYLIKSALWISGFSLVFALFLKNERFFFLNRLYLIAGIVTSFIFPFISIHYTVIVPALTIQSDGSVVSQIQSSGTSAIHSLKILFLILYLSGVLTVLTVILRQAKSVLRSIKRSEIIKKQPVKLIKTPEYTAAFSFFSYVFVNPSATDIETKEILNHELVHIRQKHWLDLLLVELLRMAQWFNPFVWMYVRFIRQNHEYLADEVALQQTSDPAVYKAVLLNQIVGGHAVSLSSSFNYSPYKKRFEMMKNIVTSPYRKMKVLLILPVFALVLYSFAKPDYKYKVPEMNAGAQADTTKKAKNNSDIIPLPPPPPPVPPVLAGSPADVKVPDAVPAQPTPPSEVNEAGYPKDVVYVVNGVKSTMTDVTKIDPVLIESLNVIKDSSVNADVIAKYGEGAKNGVIEVTTKTVKFDPSPLIVVDGEIVNVNLNSIDIEKIESMSVLGKIDAINKYGDKGKNGVIEIKLKK